MALPNFNQVKASTLSRRCVRQVFFRLFKSEKEVNLVAKIALSLELELFPRQVNSGGNRILLQVGKLSICYSHFYNMECVTIDY